MNVIFLNKTKFLIAKNEVFECILVIDNVISVFAFHGHHSDD